MANKKAGIKWKADTVRLADLKPWARNPRMSSKAQASRIVDSFSEFGQVETIAVGPRGEVYDGHQRLSALMTLHGGDYTVDVRRASVALTEAQREKLVLMLHTGATGSYDWDALANWDADVLTAGGFDDEMLAQMNRDAAAVALLLQSEQAGEGADAEPQIDKAAELAEKWGVKRGQVWTLGEHRLMCGDSTSAEDVDRLMQGEKLDAMIYDPEWDSAPKLPRAKTTLAFTDCARARDVIDMFGSPSWIFVWDCVTSWYTPNRPLRRAKLALWYGNIDEYKFDGAHYGDAGIARDVINSRGGYRFTPDPRGKHLSDVFQHPITTLHSDSEHNHSKPLDWMRMLIANCTTGNLHEPFSGSGTTIIACEQLGRKCRAMEISPEYVAVAIERFAQATGKTPALLPEAPHGK